jgi:hypothetical protein
MGDKSEILNPKLVPAEAGIRNKLVLSAVEGFECSKYTIFKRGNWLSDDFDAAAQ